jgi:hypothetical protein
VIALVAAAALALASTPQPDEYRWTRMLNAEPGSGPISLSADPSLFAHAGRDFANLRVLDADGKQVPWRPYPEDEVAAPQPLRLLDRGRSAGAAVALVDLGSNRRILRRLELDLPGRDFVGRVTVAGSDDRRTFTVLGSSRVFDLSGAETQARSTVVTFSPSDYRYLRLRATGVESIDGATALFGQGASSPVPTSARVRRRTVDLGGANVPVEALRITASARRYDRAVRVEARDPGEPWQLVAEGRVFRLYGTPSPPIDLGVSARYLRVTIVNGDDPPLPGVRLVPLARPRLLLVEGGHVGPLRIVYGGRQRPAPAYEFARLPLGELGLDGVRRGFLGEVEENARFAPAPDNRSWVSRHAAVVTAALAFAAAVVGVAGLLALRRRV